MDTYTVMSAQAGYCVLQKTIIFSVNCWHSPKEETSRTAVGCVHSCKVLQTVSFPMLTKLDESKPEDACKPQKELYSRYDSGYFCLLLKGTKGLHLHFPLTGCEQWIVFCLSILKRKLLKVQFQSIGFFFFLGGGAVCLIKRCWQATRMTKWYFSPYLLNGLAKAIFFCISSSL